MLIHLLKLVWNRKRSNLLLMLEILAAFLVVFSVLSGFLQTFQYWTRPFGYDYRDVWSVEVTRSEGNRYGGWDADDVAKIHRLSREVKQLEPVVTVALGSNRPYSHTTSATTWDYQGREIEAEIATASDDYARLLDFRLLQGRWFEESDGALAWEPVVVTADLARDLFGDENPIHRRMQDEDASRDLRVVGVLEAWRRGGEFAAPRPAYFTRLGETGEHAANVRFIMIKVAPDTRADFEEPLTDRLHAMAPEWSFTVTTLAADREAHLQSVLLPILLSATVGGFLLLMVVLGLTGVMWQNVTRRTKEIGLRRAMGASRSGIHRQVVTEVMLMAAFGLILGVFIVIQIPWVAPAAGLSFGVVLTTTVTAALSMVLLAGACGFYPGWTATRIQPARALHYE